MIKPIATQSLWHNCYYEKYVNRLPGELRNHFETEYPLINLSTHSAFHANSWSMHYNQPCPKQLDPQLK